MKKEKILKPVMPSAAIEAEYRRKLDQMIADMQASAEYWIKAAYRKSPPRVAALAQDAAPAAMMETVLLSLAKRWAKNFSERADKMAEDFISQVQHRADKTFAKYLKDAGWSVEFRMTKTVRDAVQASIIENVQLIKSIPEQFFNRLNGIVMRSYSAGRDLETMVKEIQGTYPVTQRRAVLIARDQSNKANATVNRTRQMELGITEAIWMHSHGGKEPRPDHVKANGKKYKIAEGCLISGEYIQPGELINCFPGDSYIESPNRAKKLFRRFYSGELSCFVTETGEIIESTPNHPILTNRGWIPTNDIQVGDYVVKPAFNTSDIVDINIQAGKTKFSELFDSSSVLIDATYSRGTTFQFHGDGSNDEVCTIDIDRNLSCKIDSTVCQEFSKLILANTNPLINMIPCDSNSPFNPALYWLFGPSESVISFFRSLLSLVGSHSSHTDNICFGLSAARDSIARKYSSNDASGYSKLFGQTKFAIPGQIQFDNILMRDILSVFRNAVVNDVESIVSKCDRKIATIDAEFFPNLLKSESFLIQQVRVIDKFRREFSGHVYNLESEKNWYLCNDIIAHNCRCSSRPVLPY